MDDIKDIEEEMEKEFTTDALPFEPPNIDDENAWNVYHVPASQEEIEMILERVIYLRKRLKEKRAHADAYIERKKREYEAFVERVEQYKDRATRQERKRLQWMHACLEAYLRAQPEKVRSVKFINGTLKRRRVPLKVSVTDAQRAIEWARERGMDEIVRVKTTTKESPDIAKIKELVKNDIINAQEAMEWLEIIHPTDTFEIVTPIDKESE